MERHLSVVDPVKEVLIARANREAAKLIEECVAPDDYRKLHALVALAYLTGAMHELQWANEKMGATA